MQNFVHLHLHSEYSLLDGACRIKDIPKRVKECGQNAVAITDHGNMYGAVEFYKACKTEGIKPIIGCEVYVSPTSRFEKKNGAESPYHLVLLCKNETGYKNLIYLASKAYTEGFYGKPRIDEELLFAHTEGLIALSACLSGKIPRLLSRGDRVGAKQTAEKYSQIFGKDNFYIELQDHPTEECRQMTSMLVSLARECSIPTVATNDCHYLRRKDSRTQDILMCIQTGTNINDESRFSFETDDFYLKTGEEMASSFSDIPEAIENTVKIADACNLEFDFTKLYLLKFPCPDSLSSEEYLRRLTEEGFINRQRRAHLIFNKSEGRGEAVYRERIEYELSVINKMGYADYFLIVQDYVGFAKRSGIPVGPGRGSGAGSLVAYLLGITDIDSIKFDLLFERFLNPERVSMPDIDIDFCYNRRDEVISYVAKKYGEDHVSQIVTFGTLAAKAAIRDTGRAMGMTYADVDVVAKAIPRELGITLSDAMKRPEFRELYESSDSVRDLVDTARSLEGMPRNISVHAAGVVITDRPTSEYVPLSVSNGTVVTQYDMDTVAGLGLLKFDFLALRYLTIINDAQLQIKEKYPSFDIEKIPLDDEKTFRLIGEGNTSGVFQLESGGMRQTLQNLKPENINDILAAIALYRPGPMDSIPRFIECRHDPSKVIYDIPELEPILRSTYGCTVYQEQVMSIFRDLAGYTYGHADIVRRAMSKKKASVLEAERESFIEGAKRNGINGGAAEKLFDDMSSFANYAFNKSHAAAYAMISYRSAYLKAHHTGEYMSALLTSVLDNQAKASEYIAENAKMGILTLPPSINHSRVHFSTDESGNIRYGLLALKNVGRQLIEAIIDERTEGGEFTSFDSFVERMTPRTDLNKRQIEALIKAGAFDGIGGIHRARLLAAYENIIDNIQQKNRENVAGQLDMFSSGELSSPAFDYPEVRELTVKEKLILEKEAAGIYFSGHMLDGYSRSLSDSSITHINELVAGEDGEISFSDKDKVKVAGIITALTYKTTKKDERMAFLTLEDKFGVIECIVFPKTLNKFYHELRVDSAVIVDGDLSLREDEPSKVIAVVIRPLLDNSEVENQQNSPEKSKNQTLSEPQVHSPTRSNAPSKFSAYLSAYSISESQDLKGGEESREPQPNASRRYDPTQSSAPQPKAPQKIYLRVDDLECESFKKAKNLVDIFNEGSVQTIFYNSSTKKYMEYGEKLFFSERAVSELKAILGDENVICK